MKSERQNRILKIIEEQVILTQDDLQNALSELGYNVTQSTVSRDIKQLRLVKGHDANGNYRYVSSVSDRFKEHSSRHLSEIVNRSVISVQYAFNDVVVKCYNGMAQSACVAFDTIYKDNMLGSVAGDDTILIITRTEQDAARLSEDIKKLL